MPASLLDPRRLLDLPALYRLVQSVVGGERAWRSYIATVLELRGGERLLDIGCGPGHIIPWLPPLDYHGLDIDAGYIAEAKARFGDRAQFHHRGIGPAVAEDLGRFDVVAATGVLHHLDDATALTLFRAARAALKPGGRLVTCDGTHAPGSNPIARALIAMDRGEHVRTPEAYAALARQAFDRVEVSVRHDLSRLPYTHCVLRCRA